MKWFPGKWRDLSNLGVKPDMTLSFQKKVVLSNQLSIIFFFILFVMHIFIFFFYKQVPVLSFLSIFIILTVPVLNKFGYHKLNAVLLSTLTPFFILLFTTLAKLDENNNVQLIAYIFPRLLLISVLTMPFIFIDKKYKWLIFATVLFILACIFLMDLFDKLLGVDFFQVNLDISTYYLTNLFAVFPVAVILLGLIFLTSINTKYEDKIIRYVDELQAKNELLDEQKQTIQKAFNTIEIKNRNITASINYASMIQKAILPQKEEIDRIVPENFILFHPKDVVSGDFYWIKEIEVFTKKYKILTAVDCTGHGVPGAFMSMLGVTFLNEIVKEFYTELVAGEILNRLREEVKKYLRQSTDTKYLKDGMDLSMVIIDYEDMVLQYAGAYNPLYIIRNIDGIYEKEIEIYKGDRMPIGVYIKDDKSFTNHEIKINNGDLLYMFSDGYTDQFGGEKGKKYNMNRFKEKLISICYLPLEKQKAELELEMKNWMGNKYDQIDDITILGFKL